MISSCENSLHYLLVMCSVWFLYQLFASRCMSAAQGGIPIGHTCSDVHCHCASAAGEMDGGVVFDAFISSLFVCLGVLGLHSFHCLVQQV
ncbi:hypothetical protein COO60DRAFT_1582110, partial [Scenedesmus sp. NREL 46B-D3]